MSEEEVSGSGLETDNGVAAAAKGPQYSPQDEDAGEDGAAMGRYRGMSGCRVAALVAAVLTACLGVAMLAGGYNALFDAAFKSTFVVLYSPSQEATPPGPPCL
ncbi:uncharacterized protein LOC134772561 [Penaeus indicus]|uniref:uncharacterized protein LOC134772561 n=1 Tax=Penaeus indicus TaxID=29960 RepID=UPI00300CE5AE